MIEHMYGKTSSSEEDSSESDEELNFSQGGINKNTPQDLDNALTECQSCNNQDEIVNQYKQDNCDACRKGDSLDLLFNCTTFQRACVTNLGEDPNDGQPCPDPAQNHQPPIMTISSRFCFLILKLVFLCSVCVLLVIGIGAVHVGKNSKKTENYEMIMSLNVDEEV